MRGGAACKDAPMSCTRPIPILILAAALLLLAPSFAKAADSWYPPVSDARNFNSSAGGWSTQSEQIGPLCDSLGELACPTASPSWEASGGNDGGYLGTQFGALAGVIGEARSVWTSPAFTYKGVGGKQAESLQLRLDRRPAAGDLLSLLNSSLHTTVELVPQGGGEPLTVLEEPIAAASSDWERLVASEIPALELNRSYRLRITTAYNTDLAALLAQGSVDYDNVALRARREGGGGGPGDGPGGKGDPNKGPVDTKTELRKAIAAGIAGRGTHRAAKQRFQIKARCPRLAGSKKRCTMRVVVRTKKRGGKALTKATTKRVRSTRRHLFGLRVKPAQMGRLAKAKRVWVVVRAQAPGIGQVKVKRRAKVRHR